MINLVAPHAGAWIETIVFNPADYHVSVAPHAGAWIETHACMASSATYSSRTSRGCVD